MLRATRRRLSELFAAPLQADTLPDKHSDCAKAWRLVLRLLKPKTSSVSYQVAAERLGSPLLMRLFDCGALAYCSGEHLCLLPRAQRVLIDLRNACGPLIEKITAEADELERSKARAPVDQAAAGAAGAGAASEGAVAAGGESVSVSDRESAPVSGEDVKPL